MSGSPLEKDDEDVQAAKGFWTLVKYLFKHPATWPIIAALTGGSAVLGWIRPTQPKPEDQYWSKGELRQIMREELGPAEAGIRELANHSSLATRVAVLESMDRARRKLKDDD